MRMGSMRAQKEKVGVGRWAIQVPAPSSPPLETFLLGALTMFTVIVQMQSLFRS